MSYMFNVVSDKAHATFDTSDEAVRYAMGILYLSPSRFPAARESLDRGEKFSYGYGFNQVEIIPVKKRAAKPAMTPSDALVLAKDLHNGQFDAAGRPYFSHCYRVYLETEGSARPDHIKIAAALHDVMEDCGQDEESLAALGVPRESIELIRLLTRSKSESYEEYLYHIKSDVDATCIKLADLKDNLDPFRLVHVPAGKRSELIAKYANALDLLFLGVP